MIPQLSNPEPVLSGWWPVALVFAGGAVALAVLLELRRPHLPSVDKVVDVAALAKDIQPQFQPGGRWVYWEKQNPLWWRCLTVLITVFLVAIAVGCGKEIGLWWRRVLCLFGHALGVRLWRISCGADTGKIDSTAGSLRFAVVAVEAGECGEGRGGVVQCAG